MKTKLTIFFSGICFFCAFAVFAANQVLHYRPEIVTLTGIIKVEKFPAPPKNEYIGDKEEIYRYLILDYPVDVVPKEGDSDPQNELQENVKTIQIVRIEDYNLHNDMEDKSVNSNWSDRFVGKHVRITGALYSRVVRVVMLAKHFEEIGKGCAN